MSFRCLQSIPDSLSRSEPLDQSYDISFRILEPRSIGATARRNVFLLVFDVREKRLVLSRFTCRFLIQKDLVAIQVFQHDSRTVWPHLGLALKFHGPCFQPLVVAQAIVGSYAKKRKTAALLADQREVAVALGHVQSKHRLVTVRQRYGHPSIGSHWNVFNDYEPELVRVEANRLVIVFNQQAGNKVFQYHRPSPLCLAFLSSSPAW